MRRFVFWTILVITVLVSWFILALSVEGNVTKNQLEKTLPVRSREAVVQKGSDILQFTTQGHIIGFKRDGIIMAAGDHAVRIGFVNGNNVEPVSESIASRNGKVTPPLERVVYKNLWNRIDLIYEKSGQGVVKSSYIVSPGGNPAAIRLKYNGLVEIDGKGDLAIAYETGKYAEGKPISWQERKSRKEAIRSTYRKLGNSEVGFSISGWDGFSRLVIDPLSMWNTFLGGTDFDMGESIVVDASGNIFVAGRSASTWGTPLSPYHGGYSDAFAAKLNANGVLQWHTFLGGSGFDEGYGIAVDVSGNIFVMGESESTWGSPLLPFSDLSDVFVAKLNANGALQWSTFLSGNGYDRGSGISVGGNGMIYVTGYSDVTWGSPINPHGGDYDAFVAKLNMNGALQWNTFLGGMSSDLGAGIAVDGNRNVYVTGYSYDTWGSPVNPHGGDYDTFVAELNTDGALQWSTFLGGSGYDSGSGISVDGSGSNIYVTGSSSSTWGSPINPHSDDYDAFVAKLNASGVLLWNTFLGGIGWDGGEGIAIDGSGYIDVTGSTSATWGNPINPYGGGDADAFVANLSPNGVLQWNTFLGGTGTDAGIGISFEGSLNIHVAGFSDGTWGSPLRSYGGGIDDVFVAKLNVTGSIALTSPNGGEIWPSGSKRSITWDAFGITTDVKLVLFKNGVKVGNIVTNLPAIPGSFAWTVGTYIGGTATAGTDYSVRVITMDGAFNDYSNAPFTITPLNLVSPNGFENWRLGSIHPVTWTAPGIGGLVKLVLFQNGLKVGNIVINIPAVAGTYDWTVGNYIGGTTLVGSGYTVRVITMDGVYRDDSEAPFLITASSLLNLTSPNGGETWPLGSSRAITWADGGYTGNVKLVVFKNGVKLGNIVVDIPANSSPYNWTVGSYIGGTATAGAGYVVRVISMDGVHRDDSDGPFVIQ